MDKILNIINEYSIFIVLGLAIITILLFLITIVLMISVSKVNKRYKKMMRGSKGRSIEELINSNLDRIEEAVQNSQKSLEMTNGFEEALKGCVNKVAIMRYKAFEDVGSDLSFSIALLDLLIRVKQHVVIWLVYFIHTMILIWLHFLFVAYQ